MIPEKPSNCSSQEDFGEIGWPTTTGNETLECLVAKHFQAIPQYATVLHPIHLCSLITLFLNPLILTTILVKARLRQETRYLLLANVLLADLVFLLFNSVISTCNILHLHLQRMWCSFLIVFCFAAYFSCVLTFTALVVDTYLAVCFPLHYYTLLSVSRSRKIVLGIWVLASFFPTFVSALLQAGDINAAERRVVCLMLYLGSDIGLNSLMTGACVFTLLLLVGCSLMIAVFYMKLYYVTRRSGIWINRFSRARITLLMHSALLLLYIIPGVVCIAEALMYHRRLIGLELRLWIATANSGVFTMLPRALSPVMYGLRYRKCGAQSEVGFQGQLKTGGMGTWQDNEMCVLALLPAKDINISTGQNRVYVEIGLQKIIE